MRFCDIPAAIEIRETLRETVDGIAGRRILLDEVVLDAAPARGVEDPGKVQSPGADFHECVAFDLQLDERLRRVRVLVLQVHERDPAAILAEQGDRIGAGNRGPEHVEFERHSRLGGSLHQHLEPCRAVSIGAELEGVIVIAELQPCGGHFAGHPREARGELLEPLAIGGPRRGRNPWHDQVLHTV